jgi:hypothetical protein
LEGDRLSLFVTDWTGTRGRKHGRGGEFHLFPYDNHRCLALQEIKKEFSRISHVHFRICHCEKGVRFPYG